MEMKTCGDFIYFHFHAISFPQIVIYKCFHLHMCSFPHDSIFTCPHVFISTCFHVSIAFSCPFFSRLHCFLVSIAFSSQLFLVSDTLWKLLSWQPRWRRVFPAATFCSRGGAGPASPRKPKTFCAKVVPQSDKRLPLNRIFAQRMRISVPVWW